MYKTPYIFRYINARDEKRQGTTAAKERHSNTAHCE